MRRRLPTVPRALALLLLATGFLGVSWALILPTGQAPDESAHLGYVQTLAERFELPDTEPGETFSTEQQLADEYANVNQTAGSLVTKPEWSELAAHSWDLREAQLPDVARADGGHFSTESGSNPARTNPPLYYLWESVPYLLSSGGDFFDRVYLMRLWSLALLIVSTVATWLLIGEVVGRRRTLQLAGAAMVGLFPMASFTTASVNPDGALIATWALVFWLGARIVRRGPAPPDLVALAAVTAAAVLTKATGYALVPAVGLLAVASCWLSRRRLPAARSAAIASLAFAVPVGTWLLLARLLDRRAVNEVPTAASGNVLDVPFIDYVWQFYLPKLSFQAAIPPIPRLPVFDVWIKTGWGAFGWLEVRFPNWVYIVLAGVTGLVIIGGLLGFWHDRGPRDPLLASFFGVAAACLLAGLHWVEWRSIVAQGTVFNQGRYLLPLLPMFAVLLASSLRLIPTGVRAPAAGLILGCLFTLQIFSIAIVAFRFYA
jgi:4-amino-4-deoxy-L-arabinose transferase-like glycosyltransferase